MFNENHPGTWIPGPGPHRVRLSERPARPPLEPGFRSRSALQHAGPGDDVTLHGNVD